MAESRNQITDLPSVADFDLADDDRILIRDRSDTTDGAEGTDKQGSLQDLRNNTDQRVDTPADLRGIVGNDRSIASLIDGGSGGFFRYDTSSTATDDGETVIKPDAIASADPGRWLAYFPRVGKGAGQLSTNADRNVTDVTELRSIDPSTESLDANTAVNLLGYTDPGDGGGGTLYWDASSTETDNGGTIFKPDSLGVSDPGRWKRPDTGVIHIKEFGAAVDGTTDDSSFIKTALSFLNDRGGGVLDLGVGSVSSSGNVIPNELFSNITIKGRGPGKTTLRHEDSSGALLFFNGSADSAVSVTSAPVAKEFSISVSDTSGFSVGDYAYLEDPTQLVLDNMTLDETGIEGEVVRIRSIPDSTTLTVWSGLELSYSTDARVKKLNLHENITIQDMTILNPIIGQGNCFSRGIQGYYVRNMELKNLVFDSMDSDAIRLIYAIDTTIGNCHWVNGASDAAEFGSCGSYGVSIVEGCWGLLMHDCDSEKSRHMFTVGSGPGNPEPAHLYFSNCQGRETYGAVFDTHPGGRYIDIEGCHAYGVIDNPIEYAPAFQIRTRHTTIRGCSATNAGYGITLPAGEDNLVDGFIAKDCLKGFRIKGSPRTTIRNMRVDNPVDFVGVIESTATNPTMPGIELKNIEVYGDTSQAAFQFDRWEDGYQVDEIYAPDVTTLQTGAPYSAFFKGLDVVTNGNHTANFPRYLVSNGDTISVLNSGQMFMVGVWLRKGDPITKLACIGTSGTSNQTNFWMAIYTKDLDLIGATIDRTTNTTLGYRENNMQSATSAPYTGLYYVGIVCVADTPQPLQGFIASGAAMNPSLGPRLTGQSTTGLTNPASAPSTAASLSGSINVAPWVGVG